jgi:hypothetical protein
MGPAELLLEATFMDLRHGGGGDLTKAYRFARKVRIFIGKWVSDFSLSLISN